MPRWSITDALGDRWGESEAAFGDALRDHCDLGIGSAEYTQWDQALKAFLMRDPAEGMYPDDHLVIFFDTGNSWKGESVQPARIRRLRDDLNGYMF